VSGHALERTIFHQPAKVPTSSRSLERTLVGWRHLVAGLIIRYVAQADHQCGCTMNDNVIKFRKPEPVKPPRQTPAWLRRVLTALLVIAAFVAIWAYFQFMPQAPTTAP
jgi:hypothetical protein